MKEKYTIGYMKHYLGIPDGRKKNDEPDHSYHCFIEFDNGTIWKSNVIYREEEEAFEICFKWEKLIAYYNSFSFLNPMTRRLLPERSIMENKALKNRFTVIGNNLTLAEI